MLAARGHRGKRRAPVPNAGALSNDVAMSAADEAEQGRTDGVLSKLPRTRPQRSSARRVAARRGARAGAATSPATGVTGAAGPGAGARANGRPTPAAAKAAKPAKPRPSAGRAAAGAAADPPSASAAPKRAPRGARRRSEHPHAEPVPKQGFEAEGERTSRVVQPPGGAELVASAAEIVGELAKAGVGAGERLLRDALSRLPRP